jgi:mono/diheme cytochrome c family protein
MSNRPWAVSLAASLLSLSALAVVSCSQQPQSQQTSGTQTPAGSEATTPGAISGGPSAADPVKHGEYLVQTIGCGHCHTPGGIYGEPDPTRLLSGSEVGWKGRWGVSYPANLTPDSATGIGQWSEDQIVTTLRTLKRPDGTTLHLPMPWNHFVYLSESDARAIAAYLKSIPAVTHKVPDYVAPGGKAKGAVIEFPPPPPWDAPRYR